jgi:RNA polymerase sigma-70 factor (ECF subfamily)
MLVSKVSVNRERYAVALLKEAQSLPDAGLVEECRGGDVSAFDELVRRYKDRVYNVVYRYIGHREDALDITQEVFVRAYQGIGSYEGRAQVYTWLYSIAANLARNRLRDRSRKGRVRGVSLDALAESTPGWASQAVSEQTPRDLAEHRELEEALDACLETLPDSYRLVFVLRTFDGLNYADIAASAGCPAGTVKSRLNQARKRLQDCLTQRGVL